ncbi:helix-turn-helix domain-containing protein [Microbacterium sp.]|uniref:helix-turn-helix domain-containing protein n=1 Tax=Microbacterium sp. TaxID=51671 RepID=UPI003F727259
MTNNVNPLITPGGARDEIAGAIRAHLAVRRISDSALGRAIGMSQSKISRRTNGEIAFDTDDLGRIARYLGLSVVDLIQMPSFGVGPAGFEPTTSTV